MTLHAQTQVYKNALISINKHITDAQYANALLAELQLCANRHSAPVHLVEHDDYLCHSIDRINSAREFAAQGNWLQVSRSVKAAIDYLQEACSEPQELA
jgi:hypothetical protein